MSVQELEELAARVRDSVGPSVVGIGRGWGTGSGVVVGAGQVLTNAHNLAGAPGGAVAVTFADGRTSTAEAVASDIDGDLAVVRVDTGGTPAVGWAGAPASTGAVVVAAANPGGRGLRVTLGQVSSVTGTFRTMRGRLVRGSLEHTAPLVRGSSGSPLLDRAGRLVGLNTNRLGEGFYAALPADARLRARVDRLGRGEATVSRHLGVGLVPGKAARQLRRAVGLPDRDGILVRVVEEDSPAAASGLRRGDLVVAAGGRPVASVDDLHVALDALGDDEALVLEVVRGADELTISVELAA